MQYAAEPYRLVLERHGIEPSMSRRGNCLDNAPMESFFTSFKKEHVHQVSYPTREAAKAAVFDYIEVFSIARHNAHLAMLLLRRDFAVLGSMPRGVWSCFGPAERCSGQRGLRARRA